LIASKTEADHDASILQLLQTARRNGIKFSSKKMQYKSSSVKFFGHLVTADGLKPDPDKVKAITNMTRPNTVQELQSFMGMVNYLHRFSSKLTKLAAPLRGLNKKDSVYDWQPEHQRAFEAIKVGIASPHVLSYFNADKNIVVQTDASKLGLGAVLLQEEKPVAYASRSLSSHEVNYSNIEREFLAVKFACQKFHDYVWNYDVLIQTDHLPLVSIWRKGVSETTDRLKNIHYAVSNYKLDIQYIKGKDNVIADALSRVGPQHDAEAEKDPDVHIRVHQLTAMTNAAPSKLEEYREATAKDETLRILRQTVHSGWPDRYKSVKPEIKCFWGYRSDISLEDGLLYKGRALIVPSSLRTNALESLHEGHWGKDKTTLRARDCVYWPNIGNDIAEYVRDCDICATYGNAQRREPLNQHDLPGHPWQRVAVDLFQHELQNYLLLADYYSRVPFFRKTGMTAAAIIQHMKIIFSEHGIPDEVMSDNGPQFASEEFRDFAKSYSFKHVTSSPRFPQSNGFIERMVQTVKKCLTKAADAGEDPYKAMLVYRTTPLDSRIPSPAEMLYNRRVRSTVLPPHCSKTSDTTNQEIRERMLDRQLDTQADYDRQAGSDKSQLQIQQPIYVKLQPDDKHWTKATVIGSETPDQPRSYVIETEIGRTYRRNRSHIKARAPQNTEPRQAKQSAEPDFEPRITRSATAQTRAQETPEPEVVQTDAQPDAVPERVPVPEPVLASSRPRRDVGKPSRLIEEV
jgi:transposase InsO family protein